MNFAQAINKMKEGHAVRLRNEKRYIYALNNNCTQILIHDRQKKETSTLRLMSTEDLLSVNWEVIIDA